MKYPTCRMQLVLEGIFDSVMQNASTECAFQKSSPHTSKCGMNGRRAAFSEEQVSTLNCWTNNFSLHNLFRTSK